MDEFFAHLQSALGKRATATDLVTAAAIAKLAATLGVPQPASALGDAIPPGWHIAFFPPVYGPSEMRADGQPAGGGLMPPVSLPRCRLGGMRVRWHAPLRIGDTITRVSEIADIRVEEEPQAPLVRVVERNSISNPRGLAVVEERELLSLGEGRADTPTTVPLALPAEAVWRRVIEPTPVLLFRFAAVMFNSHRIHYDREYVTTHEGGSGLVVQATLVFQLLLEMCRSALPQRPLTAVGSQVVRQLYDTGPFTIAGAPVADGREVALWASDADGNLAMTATATFGE